MLVSLCYPPRTTPMLPSNTDFSSNISAILYTPSPSSYLATPIPVVRYLISFARYPRVSPLDSSRNIPAILYATGTHRLPTVIAQIVAIATICAITILLYTIHSDIAFAMFRWLYSLVIISSKADVSRSRMMFYKAYVFFAWLTFTI